MSNVLAMPERALGQEAEQPQVNAATHQEDEYHSEGRRCALVFLSQRLMEVQDGIPPDSAIGLSYILSLLSEQRGIAE